MKSTHTPAPAIAAAPMPDETERIRAYRYYLKGLTCIEIGKLLDLSPRTVERYSQLDKWRQRANPQPMADRARLLHQQGMSYAAIARTLAVSKSTVYNYVKEETKPASAV